MREQDTNHDILFASESEDVGDFFGPESGLDVVHLHRVPAHGVDEPGLELLNKTLLLVICLSLG